MSYTVSSNSVEPNPASMIREERRRTSFNVQKMFEFLEGSKQKAVDTLSIMQQLERDPILRTSLRYYEYGTEKHREETAAKISRMAQYIEKDAPDMQTFQNRLNLIAVVDPQLGTRIGVHLGLFLGAIRGNGTDNQFNYWAFERGAAYIKGIYGCFAMTELAHGSNVAALETTATYNRKRKCFIINTPHVGATKWWIGGAAHSATHTACFARLKVDGKDYGVKVFVVPLRDTAHMLQPGIALGDIGEKMGRNGIDNGWIQFSNVEIPKEYMLSKFATISDDGEVIEPPLAQLAYSALLGGRVTMVTDSFRTSERFTTIALRYSVGRRQFKQGKAASNNKKMPQSESQIIDHPLHQHRLLPLLAWTYAMGIASNQIQSDYKATLSMLESGVRTQDMKVLGVAIKKLKQLFADSASLKSTCTWKCLQLIEECRQACGGHGYSAYSGFGKGYADHAVQCTWEGDNNILAQNAGRITVQQVAKMLKTDMKPTGNFSFLAGKSKIGHTIDAEDISDLSKLLLALETLIYRLSSNCLDLLSKNEQNWDSISTEKKSLSHLYAIQYMLSKGIQRLTEMRQSNNGGINTPIKLLLSLFALSGIKEYADVFLQFDVLSTQTYAKLKERIGTLCLEIRPMVIGMTDSFKFSDFFINSVLGCYNGDIYNDYWKAVNSLNDAFDTKAPYSHDLEAMLKRPTVAQRENFEKGSKVLQKLSN
ncbi:hypothetical protein BRETT_002165 [Brettanomyces bruxellensis]|uniref:Acyl-coenzyme A oxidase n=1 Tax=Dekkera bruxellensis TaxID=5007 RepID=A0A871RHV5_DEKBR|nr:uncharacterized protein BRETT_002165 [Brettanomyces bruxellensis]QOU22001.1 hypothetical protein BRETT_002165 [Brettanomyces bruxellensis]